MNWILKEHALEKEFQFLDFSQALEFVNKVGQIAEDMQHHPDIAIYQYCKVRIASTTHDAGSVTEKDHILARKIDEIS